MRKNCHGNAACATEQLRSQPCDFHQFDPIQSLVWNAVNAATASCTKARRTRELSSGRPPRWLLHKSALWQTRVFSPPPSFTVVHCGAVTWTCVSSDKVARTATPINLSSLKSFLMQRHSSCWRASASARNKHKKLKVQQMSLKTRWALNNVLGYRLFACRREYGTPITDTHDGFNRFLMTFMGWKASSKNINGNKSSRSLWKNVARRLRGPHLSKVPQCKTLLTCDQEENMILSFRL